MSQQLKLKLKLKLASLHQVIKYSRRCRRRRRNVIFRECQIQMQR
jgi:hypothetical protein